MTLIRLADPPRDGAAAAEIYRPAVDASIISFEEVPPDTATMASRMAAVLVRTPWLMAVEDGDVIGYAYASGHGERAGYRWSVDISAYVRSDRQGRGIGRQLYGVLLPILARQGMVNVYAGVTQPNEPSVKLHKAIGMREVGVYRGVGYKSGQWHDVVWYGLRLTEPADPPTEPVLLPQLLESDPASLERAGLTLQPIGAKRGSTR